MPTSERKYWIAMGVAATFLGQFSFILTMALTAH
jgi:hypothetical protein